MRVALDIGMDANRRNLSALTLRFAGNDGHVFDVAGSDLSTSELNWSPIVQGDTMQVEIVVAAGADPSGYRLDIPQVSHLDIDPFSGERAMIERHPSTMRASTADVGPSADGRTMIDAVDGSDYCERDIVCRSSPPTSFRNAANSVARMAFTEGGDSYLCTGTLLNNGNSPKKPLFWSANHCIGSQSVASTLQTYWFYETTTCNGRTVNPGARTLSGGAYLRFNNARRDTLLLELKKQPPSGAFYAGWNSSAIPITATAIEGIHHPAGDVKKYSLGAVTALSLNFDGQGPFYRVRWSTGVTEGGSSGSPLFTHDGNGAYQLRGGLYGGTSYCSRPRDPDYYSRFADVYSSIRSYLNP